MRFANLEEQLSLIRKSVEDEKKNSSRLIAQVEELVKEQEALEAAKSEEGKVVRHTARQLFEVQQKLMTDAASWAS